MPAAKPLPSVMSELYIGAAVLVEACPVPKGGQIDRTRTLLPLTGFLTPLCLRCVAPCHPSLCWAKDSRQQPAVMMYFCVSLWRILSLLSKLEKVSIRGPIRRARHLPFCSLFPGFAGRQAQVNGAFQLMQKCPSPNAGF